MCQFVELTSAQRLQQHKPFPVVTVNYRQIAVFRLDCTHCGDSLEEFEQKRTRQTTSLTRKAPRGCSPVVSTAETNHAGTGSRRLCASSSNSQVRSVCSSISLFLLSLSIIAKLQFSDLTVPIAEIV